MCPGLQLRRAGWRGSLGPDRHDETRLRLANPRTLRFLRTMHFRRTRGLVRTALFSFGLFSAAARADEGMWLYSAPPRAQVKAKYGFDLTDPWLEHIMKSSVRFNSGGSGS